MKYPNRNALEYFANKFWKEGTMSLSKRWKKKNSFSNYKHHRNILQTSSNNFGKRKYNKACREMEEDDEEQNKYRVSISYEEKERNSWDTLIETHLKYFVNKFQQFWKEETMSLSKR